MWQLLHSLMFIVPLFPVLLLTYGIILLIYPVTVLAWVICFSKSSHNFEISLSPSYWPMKKKHTKMERFNFRKSNLGEKIHGVDFYYYFLLDFLLVLKRSDLLRLLNRRKFLLLTSMDLIFLSLTYSKACCDSVILCSQCFYNEMRALLKVWWHYVEYKFRQK